MPTIERLYLAEGETMRLEIDGSIYECVIKRITKSDSYDGFEMDLLTDFAEVKTND